MWCNLVFFQQLLQTLVTKVIPYTKEYNIIECLKVFVLKYPCLGLYRLEVKGLNTFYNQGQLSK